MRDKIISVRVSSELISKFEAIVKSKTQVTHYAGRNIYSYNGKRLFYGGGKYTVADLLEESLEKYIQENK